MALSEKVITNIQSMFRCAIQPNRLQSLLRTDRPSISKRSTSFNYIHCTSIDDLFASLDGAVYDPLFPLVQALILTVTSLQTELALLKENSLLLKPEPDQKAEECVSPTGGGSNAIAQADQKDERSMPESAEEMEHGRSVIIVGLPEAQADSNRDKWAHDYLHVSNIVKLLDIEAQPISVYRLGKAEHRKQRMLKVVFPSSAYSAMVVRKTRAALKKNPLYGGVFIRPSINAAERQHQFEMREECRRLNNIGAKVHICNGTIRPSKPSIRPSTARKRPPDSPSSLTNDTTETGEHTSPSSGREMNFMWSPIRPY